MRQFVVRAALLAASGCFVPWPLGERRAAGRRIPKPLEAIKRARARWNPRRHCATSRAGEPEAPRDDLTGLGPLGRRSMRCRRRRACNSSPSRNADEMIAQAANADAIAGGDDLVCDERVLAAAKKVRWVAVYSAGVEDCLGKKALEKPGLVVTNMRAVAGPVMSEHTHGADVRACRVRLQVSVARQARARLERQFRGLGAAGSDRQDFAGRGPRRHRHRGGAARARARHEGHRDARELARGPGLREPRRSCPMSCRR